MRLRTRSSVDLPQPDGPMKAVTCALVERHVDALERAVIAVEEIQIAHRDLLDEPVGVDRRVVGDGRYGECATAS